MRGFPFPSMSFRASVAWIRPICPGTTPRTPTSLQVGTRSCLGGVGIVPLKFEALTLRAPQAGAATFRIENARLAVELDGGAEDVGLPGQERGVVEEVLGGEVVRPVEDDVKLADDGEGVFRRKPFLVSEHLDLRVEAMDALFRRFDL